jgi:hypothetical protein
VPFIEEESLGFLSGTVVMAGEVLVVVVVVVTFSGSVAQDPSANRHTQTRQMPMDFFMSPFYRKQARRASKQAIAQSPR